MNEQMASLPMVGILFIEDTAWEAVSLLTRGLLMTVA